MRVRACECRVRVRACARTRPVCDSLSVPLFLPFPVCSPPVTPTHSLSLLPTRLLTPPTTAFLLRRSYPPPTPFPPSLPKPPPPLPPPHLSLLPSSPPPPLAPTLSHRCLMREGKGKTCQLLPTNDDICASRSMHIHNNICASQTIRQSVCILDSATAAHARRTLTAPLSILPGHS